MKKSGKTAICGTISALSVAIMFTAYFPYLTYAIPAVAGILFAVISIEVNPKWAFGAYIASAVISLAFCEKEAATLFCGFFGYYCILKGIIEKHISGAFEYILKHIIFSAAMVLSYIIIVYVFGIPFEESGTYGKWFAAGLLVAGNIVFAVYDRGLTRVISMYVYRLHPKIQKMFK